MPLPNEHSARLEDPGKYIRFRRENDKFGAGIHAIWGITSTQKVELQAIRLDVKKFTEAEAKKWLSDHDYKLELFEPATGEEKLSLRTEDIDSVEIFAVGTWNKRHFSEHDLDEMVRAFMETKSALKPYVKLGHGEDQGVLRNSELPAAGWIENLHRVGKKLIADLKRVPSKIAALIRSGGFRTRSAEIYKDFEHGGNCYPWALKALALLGADTPAVDNLDDIVALYEEFQPALEFEAGAKAEIYNFGHEGGVTSMTQDEIKDLCDKLSPEETKEIFSLLKVKLGSEEDKHKLAEVEVQLVKLISETKTLNLSLDEAGKKIEGETKKAKEAEEKLLKFERERKEEQLRARVKDLISKKKIAPAQEELAFNILMGAEKFKVGDKEYDKVSAVLEFIEQGSGVTLLTDGETGAGDATRDVSSSGERGVELDKEIKRYAQEHKVTYKEAFISVSRAKAEKAK